MDLEFWESDEKMANDLRGLESRLLVLWAAAAARRVVVAATSPAAAALAAGVVADTDKWVLGLGGPRPYDRLQPIYRLRQMTGAADAAAADWVGYHAMLAALAAGEVSHYAELGGRTPAVHAAINVVWSVRAVGYGTNPPGWADRTYRHEASAWLYATYQHARGPAGLTFDPAWRTDTTVALAKEIAATRQFGLVPVLADALQEAGCDAGVVLTHLRNDADEMTLADWALAGLLGYGQ